MPKLASRSQLADDSAALASMGGYLRELEADPRAKKPLTARQRALVQWLGAGRQAIEDEERERGVHDERRARRLGLTARAGLLAGYPDDGQGRRAIRRDLDKPNVLVARLLAAKKAILDAQLPAVGRLVELSQNAQSERVSRDASKDVIQLGGVWDDPKGKAGMGVSINISLGTPQDDDAGDGSSPVVDVTPD